MDLIPPREILTLGYNLRGLLDIAPGEPIGGENNLLEILQGTASTLEQLQFTVSSEVFKNRLSAVMASLLKAVEDQPDATIAPELAQRLATEASMLVPAVFAECKTGFIARPTSARFRVEQLLAAPESLLHPVRSMRFPRLLRLTSKRRARVSPSGFPRRPLSMPCGVLKSASGGCIDRITPARSKTRRGEI